MGLAGGKLRGTFTTSGQLSGAEFTPNGQTVLTHTSSGVVELWDAAGKKLATLNAKCNGYPRMTAIHPDGNRAFVLEQNGNKVVVFNLATANANAPSNRARRPPTRDTTTS